MSNLFNLDTYVLEMLDPVDGQWGEWSSYTSCSRTCGTGYKKRIRNCNNPPSSNGGKDCIGSKTLNTTCNHRECPGTLNID